MLLSHSLELMESIDAREPASKSLQLGTVLLDRNGRIEAASAEACAILEVEAGAIIGLQLFGLLAETDAGEGLRPSALERAAPMHARTRARGRPVLLQLESLSSPRGGPELRLCSLAAVDTWETASNARALVQLRMTFDAVVAGLAHEVRNPLATILSLTEAALAEEPDSSHASEALRAIPFMVARIEKLIAQAQEYSRPGPPLPSLCSVSALVEAALALGATLGKTSKVERELPADLPKVYVDGEQIERLLLNLIENACRAAKSAVLIRARAVERERRCVEIEVVDDGPGVMPEIRDRIFQPFFTTRPKGVGLGLAIARDLARANGGEVSLKNPGPTNTTFCLELPTEAWNDELR